MTSKAHVDFDPASFGVRIAIRRDLGDVRQIVHWEAPTVVTQGAEGGHVEDPAMWLRIPEEDARALYEGLADHFGHSGNDTRALRRDYDAERGRVDKMLAALIGGTR